MSAGIPAEKAGLRRHLRALSQTVSRSERDGASLAVCSRLLAWSGWQRARTVLSYAALPDEISVWPLAFEALRTGRLLALPRFVGSTGQYEAAVIRDPDQDLQPGKLKIAEPRAACPAFPLKQLDLVLVPGVAFDLCGRRLGRGKGYYDRLLSAVCGLRCGVAMDWQVLPALPAEPHDEMLDGILTPTRWIACSRRARSENESAGGDLLG